MKQTAVRNRWIKCLWVLALLATRPGPAQSEADYAAYLMQERDYFRAISVYKRLLFFTDNPAEKQFSLLQIAKAYHFSNRYKSSIQFASRLLNLPDLTADYLPKAQIYLGLNYYRMRVFPLAEDHFRQAQSADSSGFALLYLGLLQSERGHWTQAGSTFREAAEQFPTGPIAAISAQLSQDILLGEELPRRRPWLATMMSALLPGSGQFYNHHYYDGVQAFLFVGAFSFASYAAYRYDHDLNTNYLSTYAAISLTGIFHLANIIGANRTARFYNYRQKEKFLEQVREKVFRETY